MQESAIQKVISAALFIASEDIIFNLTLTTWAWYFLINQEAIPGLATSTSPLSPN